MFIPIVPNAFINVSIDSINLYLSIEYTYIFCSHTTNILSFFNFRFFILLWKLIDLLIFTYIFSLNCFLFVLKIITKRV